MWAPGCDRTLLPDDWEPYQKNYDLLKSINDVTPNEVVAKTRDEKKVKPESTSDNTLADRLFNPNTSTVPYKKRDQEEPDPPMPEPTPEESPQTVDKSPENEDEEASDDTSPEDPDNNAESVETLKTNVGFTSSTGQSIAAGTNLTASFKMASTGIPLETIEPPRENLDQNQAVALTNKGTAQINYAPQQALI